MAEGNELKRLRDEILGKEIECRNLREDLNDLRRKHLQVVFEKKVNFSAQIGDMIIDYRALRKLGRMLQPGLSR